MVPWMVIAREGDSVEGINLINSLPDHMLQHILSFISTKFGIRTSLLSKKMEGIYGAGHLVSP